MTRTITVNFNRILNSSFQIKQDLRNKIDRKIESSLASLFRWALSKRQVQQAIVDQFEKDTPMCGVLSRAVEDHRIAEIDAEDIIGLDRFVGISIEEAMRDIEIESSQIKDFGEEIETVLKENQDELIDGVIEVMIERMRK